MRPAKLQMIPTGWLSNSYVFLVDTAHSKLGREPGILPQSLDPVFLKAGSGFDSVGGQTPFSLFRPLTRLTRSANNFSPLLYNSFSLLPAKDVDAKMQIEYEQPVPGPSLTLPPRVDDTSEPDVEEEEDETEVEPEGVEEQETVETVEDAGTSLTSHVDLWTALAREMNTDRWL